MKAGVLRAFYTIGITAVVATTAFGADWLSADIPFNFNVGDVQMSSGKYVVEMLSPVALQIRSADNRQSAVILAYTGVRAERFKGSNLGFTHYGDHYFLSTVRWEEGVTRELPKAKLEIQAAKNLKPQRLEVSAAR